MESILWKNIFKTSKEVEIRHVLKESPIFKKMTGRQLNKITKFTHVRNYADSEIVFKEKDPGLGMYIVLKGKVKIVVNYEKPGEETILAELGEGDFFGELSLLDEAHRSATAVATSDAQLISFFRPDLFSLSKKDPYLGNKIILELARIISHRLRKMNDEMQRIKAEQNVGNK